MSEFTMYFYVVVGMMASIGLAILWEKVRRNNRQSGLYDRAALREMRRQRRR